MTSIDGRPNPYIPSHTNNAAGNAMSNSDDDVNTQRAKLSSRLSITEGIHIAIDIYLIILLIGCMMRTVFVLLWHVNGGFRYFLFCQGNDRFVSTSILT